MFGSKGIHRRVGRAVEGALESDEEALAFVYLHSFERSSLAALVQSPIDPAITTWIVAVTDRRVLVFRGDTMNAARSELLGASPRERATVRAEPSPDKPTHLVFHFDGDDGHRFAVPLVWRSDARAVVAALDQPGS